MRPHEHGSLRVAFTTRVLLGQPRVLPRKTRAPHPQSAGLPCERYNMPWPRTPAARNSGNLEDATPPMRQLHPYPFLTALLLLLPSPAANAAPAPTRTTLTAADATLSASVHSATGEPVSSGAVDFLLPSGQSLGSAIVQANGAANLSLRTLPAGTGTGLTGEPILPVTAVYQPFGENSSWSSSASAVTAIATPQAAAVPDFAVTGNPTTITTARGAYGTTILTVASVGGYTGAVQLSCSGLPAQVNLRFQSHPANPCAQWNIHHHAPARNARPFRPRLPAASTGPASYPPAPAQPLPSLFQVLCCSPVLPAAAAAPSPTPPCSARLYFSPPARLPAALSAMATCTTHPRWPEAPPPAPIPSPWSSTARRAPLFWSTNCISVSWSSDLVQ